MIQDVALRSHVQMRHDMKIDSPFVNLSMRALCLDAADSDIADGAGNDFLDGDDNFSPYHPQYQAVEIWNLRHASLPFGRMRRYRAVSDPLHGRAA